MKSQYAQLSTRVKAVIIDGIVFMLLIYFTSDILSLFQDVTNSVRIILFIGIFIMYEPILITLFGATVGHFFNDIEVKKLNDHKNKINFPIALIRFIIKAFLGWISLITINNNKNNQAIHDIIAKSVVINYTKTKSQYP